MVDNVRADARAAVAAAMSQTRSDDVAEGVKIAVIEELQSLDPDVKIKNTAYFNHSFAPDLELTWPDDRKRSRYVYLRYSLRSASAAQDFRALGPLNPVLLSLRDDEPESVESARREMRENESESAGLLATDVTALSNLSSREQALEAAPLLELVRSSVIRGAHGLLVDETADALVDRASGTTPDDAATQLEQLTVFEDVVQELFLPEAAARLTRAVQLVRASLDDDMSSLLGDEEEAGQGIRGQLSTAELRVLLPYFLRPGSPPRSDAFWQYLGSLTTLGGIESMWDTLIDTDLTALVVPNLDAWQAKRAQAVLRNDLDNDLSDSSTTDIEAPRQNTAHAPRWRMRSGRLCLTESAWHVLLSTDKRALKGRNESPSARWDDLAPHLGGFDLAHVRLNGLVRRLEVAAENAADVYRDVTTIRETIPDDFHVPAVTVRARRQSATPILVDFMTMLAEGVGTTASVRDLAAAAVVLLGHRTAHEQAVVQELMS